MHRPGRSVHHRSNPLPTLATILAILLIAATAGRTAPAAPPDQDRGASRPGRAAGPASAPPGWLARVQRDIAEQEYQVTWQDTPVAHDIEPSWHAPNRAHGFRTYFTTDGIRIMPRTVPAPSWRWGLTLAGYGRGDASLAPAPAALVPAGHRIWYRRGAIDEAYGNTGRGLEQVFVLAAPPGRPDSHRRAAPGGDPGAAPHAAPVHIDLVLRGDLTPRIAGDGQAIDFVTATGAPALRYAQLVVTDAGGTILRARLEGRAGADGGHGGRALRLVFEDGDAVYPVTIETLLTGPAWVGDGVSEADYYGAAVATAGDVNGDGYSDILIGAEGFDNGQMDEGRTYLYLGAASGPGPAPAWTAEGDQADAAFGTAVGTAGDVNGDGYGDVIVGARNFSGGATRAGRALVYLGSPAGLSPIPAWVADGDQASENFGYSVATAGDANGDGYSDVIVGAKDHDSGEANAGRAQLYLGSALGLSPAPAWTAEGDRDGASFGSSVATAGDVNGDGYSDIVVGGPVYSNGESNEGRAWLYLGSASGPSPAADWSVEANQAGVRFGSSVATAGDVNGDGYADLLVGAPVTYSLSQPGFAYLYLGSASGLAATAAWSSSGGPGSQFGLSVATAGDVNGDGLADALIGAPMFAGQADGRVYMYAGTPSGLATSPAWVVGDAGNTLGWAVATAGDVNGDGYADILVGAPEGGAGRAVLYYGAPSGPAAEAGWTAEGNQAFAELGLAVGTAGDVNGDGLADVIVGDYGYDNGETDEGRAHVYLGTTSGLSPTPVWTAEGDQAGASFGLSAATAGDVNGDGYSDVVIGAPHFDNGATDEGRAFVYYGSSSGLWPTPVWIEESDQAGAQFGWHVGPAGDVNGDGFADVIVGAPKADGTFTDEGRAYVYHGSYGGPGLAWMLQGNQAGARYGIAVATAGDVDADGYSDILVGADQYDNGQSNEGRAYLYPGTSSGPAFVPGWFAEINQANAWLGASLGTAGDVNGDGRSDVIIGSYGWSGSSQFEGRADVYLGAGAYLASAPTWTGEGGQYGASYGGSVGTAGDVNGDGNSDVVVGAPGFDNDLGDEGRAYVYLGSNAGLPSAPSWTGEGNQYGADFGAAVGTAGDVNGDGYADILVGAVDYSDGELVEGAAFLYYGNGGAGTSLRPRQRHADGTLALAPGGRTYQLQFRVAARGRTPFGRGRARLEWEVKPVGQVFDGTGLARGAAWLDTGTAGVALNELASGLQPQGYHWRARLLYDPVTTPFQTRGPWLATPWNGWNETDLTVSTRIGGYVWSDLDHDGVRDPGEPPITGSPVNLRRSTGPILQQYNTLGNGRYDFDLPGPGPYILEFNPVCYGLTIQDQGADDFLDSDADPVTRQALVPPPYADADLTRWSAGVVGNATQSPPSQEVFIFGAHTTAAANEVVLDIQDPNPAAGITGYNVFRSGNRTISPDQWTRVVANQPDQDAGTPGIQVSVVSALPVGNVEYYRAAAYDGNCGSEGPR